MVKNIVWIVVAVALITPQIVVHFTGNHLGPGWDALLPGLAIFGAAFMLSWGAELAQMEIPQALALAFLALVAVVPEYAVDLYFAWTAGSNPEYIHYATANMTGANQLLIGLGWPVILFSAYFATRKKHIDMETSQRPEILALLAATIYSFMIPVKGNISIIDAVILTAIFIFYIIAASRAHHVEPEFEGPVEMFSRWRKPWRRAITLILFVVAGFAIFVSSEPFAEGLIALGRTWGVNEYILIKWLAPLASESPEFIVAIIFATRAMAGAALGTLVSSKVNQWTLLIASLPIAYAIGGGAIEGMEMDHRQQAELFLTSAQSLFAVFVLSNFHFSMLEATALLSLFSVQFLISIVLYVFMMPDKASIDEATYAKEFLRIEHLEVQARLAFGGIYTGLSVIMIMLSSRRRNAVFQLIRPRRKP